MDNDIETQIPTFIKLNHYNKMTYPNTIQTSINGFLDSIVETLKNISDEGWAYKPSPDKWSKKEILGHLIDSAQTNIRRLIVSQYKPNDKIVYLQNDWVKYSDYQNMNKEELIQLWYLINKHYHRVSQSIPSKSLNITCDTSAGEPMLRTLSFLIEDYWGHQQHHLDTILN